MHKKTASNLRKLLFEQLESRIVFNGKSAIASSTAAALADDSYEENDTISTATKLGALSGTVNVGNLVMADAGDWYRFGINAKGATTSKVVLNFTHSQGDLDISLYNSSGALLRTSQGTTNQETLSLSGLAAGSYYIRVYGYRGVTNPAYSLAFTTPGTTTPPPTGTADLIGATLNAANTGTWGSSISVSASVKNQRTAAAGAFTVQYYVSRDSTYSTDDVLLGSSNISGVAAGATSSAVNTSFVLPSTLPSGWTGTSFNIVMRIDSGNAISESNETNNSGQAGQNLDWDPITITAPTTTPPTTPTTSQFSITLVMSGLTAAQQQIFQAAANRWSQVIVGDLPNMTYQGVAVDDLLINASATAIDGVNGILGQAGPDAFRNGSFLPYHGIMQFDSADIAAMQANGTLQSVVMHEIGHILGIGTIWSAKGLLTGAGTSNPRFTGAQATAAYNQIFGTTATGVPVENGGGSGTRDSHWSEAVLGSELMTGYAENGAMPLSRITIGSLADLGYVVNMNAADNFTRAIAGGTAVATIVTSTGGAGLVADPSSGFSLNSGVLNVNQVASSSREAFSFGSRDQSNWQVRRVDNGLSNDVARSAHSQAMNAFLDDTDSHCTTTETADSSFDFLDKRLNMSKRRSDAFFADAGV